MIDSAHRESDSPYIARVWRGSASGTGTMTSIAASTWSLVFRRDGGRTQVTLRGPESAARTVRYEGAWESIGIDFAHGSFLPRLPVARLRGGVIGVPEVVGRRFRLRGEWFEIPEPDTAELLVDRLVRSGVLVRDPLVDQVVCGEPAPVGSRSVQRRVIAASGQSKGAIQRTERARLAAALLGAGVPPLEVVHRAGYYDQPHLARSLRRFIGRTATELRECSKRDLPLLYAITPEPRPDERRAELAAVLGAPLPADRGDRRPAGSGSPPA